MCCHTSLKKQCSIACLDRAKGRLSLINVLLFERVYIMCVLCTNKKCILNIIEFPLIIYILIVFLMFLSSLTLPPPLPPSLHQVFLFSFFTNVFLCLLSFLFFLLLSLSSSYSLEKSGLVSPLLIRAMAAMRRSSLCSIRLFILAM